MSTVNNLYVGNNATEVHQKKEHYVDNKQFLHELIIYRNKCAQAKEAGQPKPRVSNYIGDCFLKIATHLSYRPNFINYMYREDMIGDGIENCIQYIHNFDPDKSSNPFAYFTHRLCTMHTSEELLRRSDSKQFEKRFWNEKDLKRSSTQMTLTT